MRLKSFFADTIEEAIAQARQEMGPDAMLVNSKPTSAEGRHLGAYEVVICAEKTDLPGSGSEMAAPAAPRLDSPSLNKLSRDVSELRRQMERLALALARSGTGLASQASDAEQARILSSFADAELDLHLAYEMIGRLGTPLSASAARNELLRMVRVNTELGAPGAPGRIVAVVGPPGAGKTSALVKLAVQYGITARRPSLILSVDTYRIAASEELRSYAAILGIGCQILDTTAALAQSLEDHQGQNFVFIDTPGLCRSEMDDYQDLAQCLASHPGVDTHLVLPAPMRAADLSRVATQYAIFQPKKLLFTRLDETETFGPMLSQSLKMDIPISFLSRGQRIPEDLEPADPETIVDLVLGPATSRESQFDKAAA